MKLAFNQNLIFYFHIFCLPLDPLGSNALKVLMSFSRCQYSERSVGHLFGLTPFIYVLCSFMCRKGIFWCVLKKKKSLPPHANICLRTHTLLPAPMHKYTNKINNSNLSCRYKTMQSSNFFTICQGYRVTSQGCRCSQFR